MGSRYHFKKPRNRYRKLGKVDTPLNEKLKKVKWGEYRIEDVLQWQPQKEIDPLKLDYLKDKTEPFYPFYGQATIGNGIISHNQLTNKVLNNEFGKPTILIHSNNQNIVYLETPFYLKDGHGATSVLQCDKLNSKNQMFIIASIDKVIKSKYSYNNKATKIELKNTIIKLPTKNGVIDFEFMESFVNNLEEFKVDNLKTYLLTNGLYDYNLTTSEQQALSDFANGQFKWGEFKVSKLFEIQNTLSFNKEKLVKGIEYDYVTRTSQNQGILQQTGFVNSENINCSGNWSLGLLQMDFFYRHKPWYAGQFVRKINTKMDVSRSEVLFLSGVLNKLKQKLLTVLVRDVDKTFLNSTLKLPVLDNNLINYTLINSLISSLQKLIIKDLVLYVDRKKGEFNKMNQNANV